MVYDQKRRVTHDHIGKNSQVPTLPMGRTTTYREHEATNREHLGEVCLRGW